MTTYPKYFDFRDDLYIPGRWHLSTPDVDETGRKIDPWQFKRGELLHLNAAPLIRQAHPGRALEFSLTGLTVPLVTRRVVSILERLGVSHEVQFIPARLEGSAEPYFILNTLRVIRCIDDARCTEALHWLPEDNRPEKLGQYKGIIDLKIDPSQVGDTQIFRPWGWRVVLIASERVKQALESEGVTGIEFTEV